MGAMIRQLSTLGPRDLSSVDADFVRIAAEQSNQGADTSNLTLKQLEQIDSIFREYFV